MNGAGELYLIIPADTLSSLTPVRSDPAAPLNQPPPYDNGNHQSAISADGLHEPPSAPQIALLPYGWRSSGLPVSVRTGDALQTHPEPFHHNPRSAAVHPKYAPCHDVPERSAHTVLLLPHPENILYKWTESASAEHEAAPYPVRSPDGSPSELLQVLFLTPDFYCPLIFL